MDESESKVMNKYSDEEIIENFFTCWSEGDPDDIKSALYLVVTRFGGTFVSKETEIPRTTLYDMCKDSSNPTLENLCQVYRFLREYEKRLSARSG